MMCRILHVLAVVAAMVILSGCYTGVSFSPDSKRLVVADHKGLHVMNADGSGARTLPNSDGGEQPSWSPDGRWIAFANNPIAYNGEKQRFETWIYDNRTGKSRKITDEFGAPYSWREDGARLAGIRPGEGKRKAQLYVCDPDGGDVVRVMELPSANAGGPLWVPHTDMLVVQVDDARNLYLVDGPECRRITTTGGILGAGLSADGSKLYWVRQPSNTAINGWQVYRYDLAKMVATRLPFPSTTPFPAPLPGFHADYMAVDIGPGARKMIVSMLLENTPPDRPNSRGKSYVVSSVMTMDGKEAHVIRTGGTAAKRMMRRTTGDLFETYWSPDGKHIALQEIVTTRKRNRLFIYDAYGRNERCIYTEPSG